MREYNVYIYGSQLLLEIAPKKESVEAPRRDVNI